MEKSPHSSSYKLRRQVNSSLRKRDYTEITHHSPCPSTHSAEANQTHHANQIMSFNLLQNQHSVLSAGGDSTTNSAKSRKRRREFLDLDTEGGCENELVRFVLDTQGRLERGAAGGPSTSRRNLARVVGADNDNDDESFKK